MQAALAASVATAVRGLRIDGRQVPTRNFHLTLAFLGAVPRDRLGTLDEIAARCARSFGSGGPISLTLDALEYWRKPRVLCATASGAPAAADEFAYGSPSALADALKRALTDAAFAPDLKPFRPHVTLARKVTQCVPPRTIESVTWKFGGFALVESDAGAEGSGSSYSTVKKWILDKRD